MATKINHHYLGQLRKKVERKSKQPPFLFGFNVTDIESERKQAKPSCHLEKDCAN